MSHLVNPADAALILIDQQVLSMALMRTLPPEAVKANNIALVKAAQALDIPQVWTSSTEDENGDWWLPELAELDPAAFDTRVKRTGIIDSWGQPEFVDAVEATGRRTLLIAGTSTDGCLLFTALSAKHAGFDVHAIVDASASAFPMSEQASFLRMAHEGITLTSTSTLIGELAGDWQTPTGALLRTILGEAFTATIGEFTLTK